MSSRHCPACGEPVCGDDSFCAVCGGRLAAEPPPAPYGTPPAPIRRGTNRGLRLTVACIIIFAVVSAVFYVGVSYDRLVTHWVLASVDEATQAHVVSEFGMAIAVGTTSPGSRPEIVTVEGDDLLTPDAASGKTVRFSATVLSVSDAADDARLLVVSSGGSVVPVHYLGGAQVEPGDRITVIGELVEPGGARADDIIVRHHSWVQDLAADHWRALAVLSWVTAGVCVLLAVSSLILVFRSARFRKRIALLSQAALLGMVLVVASGCTVEIHTVFDEMGKGSITTRMTPPEEDDLSIDDLPNLESYLRNVRQRIAVFGTVMTRDGDTFTFHREFESPSDISTSAERGDGGYTDLRITREPGRTRYIFTTRVDTSKLGASETLLAEIPSARERLMSRIETMDITYRLDMPGRVEFANGTVSGSTVTWLLPADQTIDLRAESVIGDAPEPADVTFFVLWMGALVIAGGLAALLLVIAMVWYRVPADTEGPR